MSLLSPLFSPGHKCTVTSPFPEPESPTNPAQDTELLTKGLKGLYFVCPSEWKLPEGRLELPLPVVSSQTA